MEQIEFRIKQKIVDENFEENLKNRIKFEKKQKLLKIGDRIYVNHIDK